MIILKAKKPLALIVIFVLIFSVIPVNLTAQAAPTVVIENSTTYNGVDLNFNVPVGSNLLIFIWATGTYTSGYTSIEYDGAALTKYADIDSVETTAEIWYLKNPSTGTNLINGTGGGESGTTDNAGVFAISGADITGDPFRYITSETGNSDTADGLIDMSIDSNDTDLILDIVAKNENGDAATQGVNQTYVGGNNYVGISKADGAASVALAWDLIFEGANDYTWLAVSIDGGGETATATPTETPVNTPTETPVHTPTETPTPGSAITYVDINGNNLALEHSVSLGEIALVIAILFVGSIALVYVWFKIITHYLS